jgi:restriction system protein
MPTNTISKPLLDPYTVFRYHPDKASVMHPFALTHGIRVFRTLRQLAWTTVTLVSAPFVLLGWCVHSLLLTIGPLIIAPFLGWIGHRLRSYEQAQFQHPMTIPHLRTLTPLAFSLLIASYYERIGYRVVPADRWGHDSGVDMILIRDTQRIGCQWRQYRARRITASRLRELAARLAAHKLPSGILLTTGHLQPGLEPLARQLKIRVIDGDVMERMLNDYIAIISPTRPPCTSHTRHTAPTRNHGLSRKSATVS